MPKKTTDQKIDELAISIGRGFESVDRQFADLTENIKDQFIKVSERFDRIEFLVSGQERRLSVLEDKVHQIARKVGFENRP